MTETWAVAAVAVIDAAGTPLLLRSFTSPTTVLQSPLAPAHAHLYVNTDDIVRLHLLIFAAADACDDDDDMSTAAMTTTTRKAAATATTSASPSSRRHSVDGADKLVTATAAVAAAEGDGGGNNNNSNNTSAVAGSRQHMTRSSNNSSMVSTSRSHQHGTHNSNSSFAGPAATVDGASFASTTATTANTTTNTATNTTTTTTCASVMRSFALNAQEQSRLVTPTTDVRYVGLLVKDDRFACYGFCSVTRVTTLLVTVGADEAPADAVVPLCRAVYECASAALCNPFHTPALLWRAQQAVMRRLAHEQQQQQEQQQHEQQQGAAMRATAARADEGAHDARGGADRRNAAKGTDSDDDEEDDLVACAVRNVALTYAAPYALPPCAYEHSWPVAAPTAATLSHTPSLALSRTLNAQLEQLLAPFTATTRSCIVTTASLPSPP